MASDKKHCDENDNKSWIDADGGIEIDHLKINEDVPALGKEKSNRNSAPIANDVKLENTAKAK